MAYLLVDELDAMNARSFASIPRRVPARHRGLTYKTTRSVMACSSWVIASDVDPTAAPGLSVSNLA
jgi:hypothetical protein